MILFLQAPQAICSYKRHVDVAPSVNLKIIKNRFLIQKNLLNPINSSSKLTLIPLINSPN